MRNLLYIMFAMLICACGGKGHGADSEKQPGTDWAQGRAGRMSKADSLYSAAAFRKAVKSATFIPRDTIHDFGEIDGKRKVSHQFVFTNKGIEPVVIDTVKSHCGCTTSSYTRQPVMPGKTGVVTVTYDPTDHYGGFRKTATLVLNGGEEYQEVKVIGHIKDKY